MHARSAVRDGDLLRDALVRIPFYRVARHGGQVGRARELSVFYGSWRCETCHDRSRVGIVARHVRVLRALVVRDLSRAGMAP